MTSVRRATALALLAAAGALLPGRAEAQRPVPARPTISRPAAPRPATPPAAQQGRRIPPLYPVYTGPRVPERVDSSGLFFRLDEASTGGVRARSTVVTGRLLTAAESQALLARLQPLRTRSAPSDSFFFPAQTLAPPRAGTTIAEGFPPRDSTGARPGRPGIPAAAALEVIRRAPEGEVDVGAEVTITFSQPMVPLGSVGDVAARAVPARITPQPAGRWRWIDARTLKFEPGGRLPMATEYTVEVPAGTRSATGTPLAAALRWTFSTPAAQATGASPQPGPTELTPILVVAFDQRIDPAAVLRSIRLRAAGIDRPLRLATAREVADDERAKALTAGQTPGRWLAFRPVAPLPRDAQVRVSAGPGTPSAEGPRLTTVEQFWEFRTYGPLRVTGDNCPCRPGQPFFLQLTNPLDERAFRPAQVRVEPAIPGMGVSISGQALLITGETRQNTRYTVRLDAGIRDVFGQTLGTPQTRVMEVGAPYATLNGPSGMMVLDPLVERALSFSSQGHRRLRLRINRVQPADWYRFGGGGRSRDGGPALLPGTPVVDRVLTLDTPPGEEREVRVDLSPALANGLGQVVVALEALDGKEEYERLQASYVWVQSTRIGVSAFSDATDLLAWATSLVDGAPLAGAEVRLLPSPAAGAAGATGGTTDARGLATFALPASAGDQPLLVATQGADVAFLARGTGGYANWQRQAPSSSAAWYAFTDRNLYRPGETVRFKGWVRRIAPGKDGSVALLTGTGARVAWIAYDARRNEIARGTAALTALGGFDGAFAVPAGANLGYSQLELTLEGSAEPLSGAGTVTQFQVQEFRRPEYTVSVSAQEGPHFIGGSAEVTASASYFAGGALPGAPVHWQVTATPGSYTPPGWDEWTFGEAPVFFYRAGRRGGADTRTLSLDGATDAAGQHVLRIGFTRADPPRPYTVEAEATVTDVNRQTWSASTTMLVHPAEVYVGLRTRRAWLQAGDSIDLDLVVVDLDGKPVAGRTVHTTAVRRGWRQEQGEWKEVVEDSTACVRESAPQPVRCVFRAAEGGRYEVEATVTDARGRPATSSLTVWVSGGRGFAMGPEENGGTSAELIPDRRTYAVGDTARLLLRTQFIPARALLTVRREGLVRSEELRVDGPLTTLSVRIGEGDVPNVYVQVDLVGASDGRHGEGARGVSFAVATVSLSVPPATRTLAVKPLPRDTAAAPDAQTEVSVEVRDPAGRPVAGAEVALVVVDEAVLALTGYSIPDPLSSFYRQRGPGVGEVRIRPLVQVVAPDFEPAPHTVVGRVVDARNGGYIGGARVMVEGSADSVRTDDAGRFRLASVAPGRRTVVVSYDGYAPARVEVEVGETAPAPLRVSLVPLRLAEMAGYAANGGRGVMRMRAVAADAPSMAMQEAAPMPAPPPPPPPPPPAPGGEAPVPIAVRSNFDPLALFSPVVVTGPDGRATVPFKLPSNLTRYRVTAVAVEGGTRYGLGESGVTARQPLMVRPSAPRFLNWGDRFELPVVIQNQTGMPVEVDVAARASGVNVTETGRRVTVPAHDRVEVRLAAEAAQAGPAFFQVAAASGTLADAAEGELPVYTPATAEAFATYGTFTGDSAQTLPLQVPGDAIPAFGGLEVTTSSTALQELTDALLYLVRYPYECAEQIASRILGVTALRDVLYAFRTEELPAPEQLQASVQRDVRALAALQNPDGGFGLWARGDRSFPYASIHAAHALQRAKEKGYDVPAQALARAQAYLRGVPANLPAEYPQDVKRALHAYALYVRARMDDPAAGDEVRRFVAATPRDSLTVEMAGWLLSAAAHYPALAAERDQLLRVIDNRATETASTATFATRYSEGEYLLLHSQRRTDGVVLEALLAAKPDNPLVPKVVRGLLGHRVKGRWDNTQENAWVLLALDRYFHQFEGQTPEFVARVWLGKRFAGSHPFNGRQADRWLVSVPMRVLQEDRPGSVTIGKEGPGRIYWRAGLRYAPRDLELAPLDAGFAVARSYEAVDDPRDVSRGADGRWHVKAGARVRVTLTMTAPSRRLHVALVDPLPAGFEPVNPELLGARETPPAQGGARPLDYGWWWRLYWYEHQNLRDDRAEAFTSLLPAGTYTYSYVARATTPGQFIVPPPRAEEMYSPETFGRGRTERVVVEPDDEK
jgi:uncharacterized protein YfaS (alpha-2-macroglobulin family)